MKEIRDIILEQIEEYNENLEEKIDTSKGDDAVLFGSGGVLESVDFVTLILDITQAVEDEYGKPVAVFNEKAMAHKTSPFRTVGTLTEYIKKVLED